MIVVAGVVLGYLIGSAPSADLVARLHGHDLRNSGSGNPGTANALRVAGRRAAVVVLVLDLAKGAAAVVLGRWLGGDVAGVAAGLAAVAGQVLNPWFRFRGGKGLGVAGGVNLAAWPWGFVIGVGLAAAGAAALKSARGATVALAGYLVAAVVWAAATLPTAWGVSPGHLWWLAAGIVVVTLPKFLAAIRR